MAYRIDIVGPPGLRSIYIGQRPVIPSGRAIGEAADDASDGLGFVPAYGLGRGDEEDFFLGDGYTAAYGSGLGIVAGPQMVFLADPGRGLGGIPMWGSAVGAQENNNGYGEGGQWTEYLGIFIGDPADNACIGHSADFSPAGSGWADSGAEALALGCVPVAGEGIPGAPAGSDEVATALGGVVASGSVAGFSWSDWGNGAGVAQGGVGVLKDAEMSGGMGRFEYYLTEPSRLWPGYASDGSSIVIPIAALPNLNEEKAATDWREIAQSLLLSVHQYLAPRSDGNALQSLQAGMDEQVIYDRRFGSCIRRNIQVSAVIDFPRQAVAQEP